MTAKHADSIIDGYLKRLDGELADLPSARRKEVSSQIAEHITEARSQLSEETDADVLTILDRLGEPDEIAAEARSRLDIPVERPGPVEILALMFLFAGGVVLSFPPVPWLIGIALVWRARTWSPRVKYFGAYAPFVAALALLAIGGLLAGLLAGHGWFEALGAAIFAFLLFPLGSGIFLATRLRGRLPVLGWIAIAIVCVAVYVPAGSLYVQPTASAFIGTPGGEEPAANCGGFYGTLQFSPHTPMVARVPVSVGICWDGTTVRKTWGPDCYPEFGLGEVVAVQSCTVQSISDGSLMIQVQATEKPLTSFYGEVSWGTTWQIGPDGHIQRVL